MEAFEEKDAIGGDRHIIPPIANGNGCVTSAGRESEIQTEFLRSEFNAECEEDRVGTEATASREGKSRSVEVEGGLRGAAAYPGIGAGAHTCHAASREFAIAELHEQHTVSQQTRRNIEEKDDGAFIRGEEEENGEVLVADGCARLATSADAESCSESGEEVAVRWFLLVSNALGSRHRDAAGAEVRQQEKSNCGDGNENAFQDIIGDETQELRSETEGGLFEEKEEEQDNEKARKDTENDRWELKTSNLQEHDVLRNDVNDMRKKPRDVCGKLVAQWRLLVEQVLSSRCDSEQVVADEGYCRTAADAHARGCPEGDCGAADRWLALVSHALASGRECQARAETRQQEDINELDDNERALRKVADVEIEKHREESSDEAEEDAAEREDEQVKENEEVDEEEPTSDEDELNDFVANDIGVMWKKPLDVNAGIVCKWGMLVEQCLMSRGDKTLDEETKIGQEEAAPNQYRENIESMEGHEKEKMEAVEGFGEILAGHEELSVAVRARAASHRSHDDKTTAERWLGAGETELSQEKLKEEDEEVKQAGESTPEENFKPRVVLRWRQMVEQFFVFEVGGSQAAVLSDEIRREKADSEILAEREEDTVAVSSPTSHRSDALEGKGERLLAAKEAELARDILKEKDEQAKQAVEFTPEEVFIPRVALRWRKMVEQFFVFEVVARLPDADNDESDSDTESEASQEGFVNDIGAVDNDGKGNFGGDSIRDHSPEAMKMRKLVPEPHQEAGSGNEADRSSDGSETRAEERDASFDHEAEDEAETKTSKDTSGGLLKEDVVCAPRRKASKDLQPSRAERRSFFSRCLRCSSARHEVAARQRLTLAVEVAKADGSAKAMDDLEDAFEEAVGADLVEEDLAEARQLLVAKDEEIRSGVEAKLASASARRDREGLKRAIDEGHDAGLEPHKLQEARQLLADLEHAHSRNQLFARNSPKGRTARALDLT
eukprot:TRINITY_DN6181_c0_g1_i1.p1 TRINITY_DN6181_c0_g1~~TRINITY_DN6181_c0_g1_i1.p1  ORF type:complete len:1005 (+),score=244.86 TRINITY_DN6181_c0_g1_i1:153-3017(+)